MFWQCNQDTELKRKVFKLCLLYEKLRFIHFAQRTSVNRINRSISENRHNLTTLRLV